MRGAVVGIIGLVVWSAMAILIFVAVNGLVEYFTPKPTPDQLYGCTIAQQTLNGECQ